MFYRLGGLLALLALLAGPARAQFITAPARATLCISISWLKMTKSFLRPMIEWSV
ncbi:hypothetical protein [Hymenobacter terricola]|uniref:hypothetical protein n=1 Tax=Hymenobacter terricola TaxID=2819236 RepID=UPI001B3041DF|nr:hypothetical protein [Hymenobacter terricola]